MICLCLVMMVVVSLIDVVCMWCVDVGGCCWLCVVVLVVVVFVLIYVVGWFVL